MRVTDADNSSNDMQVVDTLFINLDDLLPGDAFTAPVSYSSFTPGYFTATLSFRVVCTDGYYGRNCSAFCNKSTEGDCNIIRGPVHADIIYNFTCQPNGYTETIMASTALHSVTR